MSKKDSSSHVWVYRLIIEGRDYGLVGLYPSYSKSVGYMKYHGLKAPLMRMEISEFRQNVHFEEEARLNKYPVTI